MRILHAVHRYPPEFEGGTERYVAALTRAQTAAGHQVTVFCGSEQSGPGLEREEHDGVEVVRVRRDLSLERYRVDPRLPRLRGLWREELDRVSPELVHVHHWFLLGDGLVREARARGLPVVVSLHDYFAVCPRFFLVRPDGGNCARETPVEPERCVACLEEDHDGTREELRAELELRRRAWSKELALADLRLVPSASVRDTLRATGLLDEEALAGGVVVLPLGLLEPLAPRPRLPDPEGRLRLVHFGRLEEAKGVHVLLDALESLDDEQRRRFSVRVLGDGSDPDYVRRIGERLERLGGVLEPAYDRARLERLAAEADVAVFPGLVPETYALVVDEALALGLPAVVSDIGAAPGRVGEAGVVVPPGDAAALAAVLRELSRAPERVERLRTAARTSRRTIADHAAELEALYREASERARAAPRPAPFEAVDEARLLLSDRVNDRFRRERDEPPPFQEGSSFPPLLPFDAVPRGRVVVVAPHPDDEVIGAGGALALHAARGDEVHVVHLTDGGGAGDPAERAREAEAAGRTIGAASVRGLRLPDGGLRPGDPFAAALAGVLETLAPEVLYAPSPFEDHGDHRAAVRLVAEALSRTGLRPQVLLYEVNESQPPTFLVDVTSVLDVKRRALACFASQRGPLDVVEKALALSRARTVNVDLPQVEAAEAFARLPAAELGAYVARAERLRGFLAEASRRAEEASTRPTASHAARPVAPVTCVLSTWNKKDDVRENLLALRRQTLRPAEIVVVDNCSRDGTAEMIRSEFPEVKLLVTEHDRIGACETFNRGFAAATQPFVAILDDDIVAPPDWLEKIYARMQKEPESTAMISSKIVEPGMPESFLTSPEVNRERYLSTFRGCATLARRDVLLRAGGYDERFFIYGNERDLAARVLGLGYRILQYPEAEVFHKTPFGLKPGRRSLYYHVRNFWLYSFKNCSWGQVARAAAVLVGKGLGLRRRGGGEAVDATGTIGLERSLRETPGGFWIAVRATFAALLLLPYCLRRRRVCRHPDFEPPVR